jgi:hypothetical protein
MISSPRTDNASSSAARLDPRLLGRPMHLLPRFGALLRDDLSRSLQAGVNRRWGASFRVGQVTIARTDAPDEGARWLALESAAGTIGFALDRRVLLAALGYRYGTPVSTPGVDGAAPVVRETATEERLAATLGQQWVDALAARIEAGLKRVERDAGSAPEWRARAGSAPNDGAWTGPRGDHGADARRRGRADVRARRLVDRPADALARAGAPHERRPDGRSARAPRCPSGCASRCPARSCARKCCSATCWTWCPAPSFPSAWASPTCWSADRGCSPPPWLNARASFA